MANPTTTKLTPNSQSVVTMTAEIAQIQFQVLPSDTAYWSPSVGSSDTGGVELGSDIGNAIVTFEKGLMVKYEGNNTGGYSVLLYGKIKDGSSVYNKTGLNIGTWTKT